jgi:cold shock CspA family protein
MSRRWRRRACGLNEGQRVQFEAESDKCGPKAVNLKLV